MKIQIQAHQIKLPKALSAHVERRLSLALARFGERVDRVILRFSEAGVEHDGANNERQRNGSTKNRRRNGVEKRCEIVVSLQSRRVRVEDTDIDFLAAFDRAASRASRTIARAIDRESWWEAGPPTRLAEKFRLGNQ
jgi:ribosomal subunit interface protein